MEVWSDPNLAQRWSEDPTRRNPTRVEQLDILLSLIQDLYQPNKTIVDVGIGSGIVTSMLLEKIPDANVLGIDGSPAMVKLAHERLIKHQDQYDIIFQDLTSLDSASSPEGNFQIAFSVQTIHNIPDEHKLKTFEWIYQWLEADGWFFLLDRFEVHQERLFPATHSLWQRLNHVYDSDVTEGDSFAEHVEKINNSEDIPASLEQHLDWLRNIGFDAECLHLHGNRGLIVTRK